jgi:hypothetical protein
MLSLAFWVVSPAGARSGAEQFHGRILPNNATRLSGKEWLCSATNFAQIPLRNALWTENDDWQSEGLPLPDVR